MKSIEDLFLRDQLNQEALNKLEELVKLEQKISKEVLLHKFGDTNKVKMYDIQKLGTMWSTGVVISNGIITLDNVVDDQANLKQACNQLL